MRSKTAEPKRSEKTLCIHTHTYIYIFSGEGVDSNADNPRLANSTPLLQAGLTAKLRHLGLRDCAPLGLVASSWVYFWPAFWRRLHLQTSNTKRAVTATHLG